MRVPARVTSDGGVLQIHWDGAEETVINRLFLDDLVSKANAFRRLLEELHGFHKPHPKYPTFCEGCTRRWPCPTMKMVDGDGKA